MKPDGRPRLGIRKAKHMSSLPAGGGFKYNCSSWTLCMRLYEPRKLHHPGAAMSSDWEVFASILVRDLGKKLAAGIDLSQHEVKSAFDGGSYEYQYHKDTGKQKLRTDAQVGHLFFDHRNNLGHVDLRYAHGSSMKEFFRKWLREFPEPYGQRYRKSVPFKWVEKNAILLMTLENGEVTYPVTSAAPATDK